MLRAIFDIQAWVRRAGKARSRTAKCGRALFSLPAIAVLFMGSPARAEPQAHSASERDGARLLGVLASVDLDATAEYYRGYRDALRDAARLSRPFAPYRPRTNPSEYRTWPPPDRRQRERGTDQPAAPAASAATVEPPNRNLPLVSGRQSERFSARSSAPLRSSPGAPADTTPGAALPGAGEKPVSSPLPLPQSHLPHRSSVQPQPAQVQAVAPTYDPAGLPR